MTKKEIVRTISEEIGLTQLQTKEIVQKTFDAIVEALVAERRIRTPQFWRLRGEAKGPPQGPQSPHRRQGVRPREICGHV